MRNTAPKAQGTTHRCRTERSPPALLGLPEEHTKSPAPPWGTYLPPFIFSFLLLAKHLLLPPGLLRHFSSEFPLWPNDSSLNTCWAHSASLSFKCIKLTWALIPGFLGSRCEWGSGVGVASKPQTMLMLLVATSIWDGPST